MKNNEGEVTKLMLTLQIFKNNPHSINQYQLSKLYHRGLHLTNKGCRTMKQDGNILKKFFS